MDPLDEQDWPDDEMFTDYIDLVPEGCIPIQGVRIVRYMDEDGDECIAFDRDGHVNVYTFLALIEGVKLQIFESRTHLSDLEEE